ncbi:DcaP family trimeric outer membrane transporter [Colwellia sp. 12G3]|uniref:DcaP family trimeric outer membrane transporter n=1 Tax=Colwellia sp. 12G3 TaxID=2058299 RepID=UPI000C3363F9|nr:DcaP family trimeric outer membrane transporter [Colwellia sp. 12G3]PKI17718.1 hypothetical protein CXF71_02710 [Colwellia sp. 12G3]
MTNHAQKHPKYRRFSVVSSFSLSLVALSTLCSVNAYSQQTDQERIQSLEQRLLELEQQIQKKNSQNSATTKVQPSKADSDKKVIVIPKTSQRPSHDFEAPDKSIVLSNSDTTLQIGGQIWLDAIYNNGEMTNRAGFQPSSIAYENDTTTDNTLFSVGQSNLSFKSFTPTKYGVMTTRFEFDLFDSQGNAGINLTHMWGEIGDFGAGQTFTGFMDINSFPNILDFWGPNSLVFARQPQIRYSTDISKSGRIMFTVEKSASDFAVPRYSTGEIPYDDINELPDFTASYLHRGDFGYINSAMVFRQLGYKATISGTAIEDTTLGWGLNVTGKIAIASADSINFQLAYGEGIGRYINDTCCSYYSGDAGVEGDETGGVDAGLDGNGNLTAIPVTAGFAFYNRQWSKKWSSAIGYSYLSVDNLVTQKNKSIKNSSYSTVNLIWYPASQIKAGVEMQYGDIQSKAQFEADNFRFQLSVGFKY